MPSDSYKQVVAKAVHELLASRRFKKKALVFSRILPDVVQFVTLQSSNSSTATDVKLTVNLGVLIPSLSEGWSPQSVWTSHWQHRLGALLPEPSNRWWQICSDREASVAAHEIVAGLRDYGLPRLDALTTKAAIVDLWQSGQSPGITDGARGQYLNRIANETYA